MYKIVSVCFLLVLLSACTLTQSEPVTSIPSLTPIPDEVREEERVYTALIAAKYPADFLVIMQQTQTNLLDQASEETYQQVEQGLANLSVETLVDFKTRNAISHALRTSMILGVRYILFSENDKQELFQINQSGWDVFYNRYPEAPGIITLSRVGFNNQFDQALVYLGIQSNWLAGEGNYFLLKKVYGEWIIDQQVMTWIS